MFVSVALTDDTDVELIKRLTIRWSGPGILRHEQEIIELRAQGKGCEGANPSRSARRRYAAN